MKDTHFYNTTKFFDKMITAVVETNPDDDAFAHVLREVFEPLQKRLDYMRDNLDREVDGKTKMVDLLFDDIGNPDFQILPGEAECVVRRYREMKRLLDRIDALIKPRNEAALKSIEEDLFGENGLLAALCGKDVERPELKMTGRCELAEAFLGVFREYADVEMGALDGHQMYALAICYALCSDLRDGLEKKAKADGSELTGDDATEYMRALTTMDELRAEAAGYLEKHPDFDLFDTGMFGFDEEESSPEGANE